MREGLECRKYVSILKPNQDLSHFWRGANRKTTQKKGGTKRQTDAFQWRRLANGTLSQAEKGGRVGVKTQSYRGEKRNT